MRYSSNQVRPGQSYTSRPPSYTEGPEPALREETRGEEAQSEETALIDGIKTRRNLYDKGRLFTLFTIGIFILSAILSFRAASLRKGLAADRARWEDELEERRLEERSRIDIWEREFHATQERLLEGIAIERARWNLELVERRTEEQTRIYEWECEFSATQERLRESIAMERAQWESERLKRRQDEQSRIQKWEREFNAIQERDRLQEEKWQREEEERERLGLYWGELEAAPHCAGYNTREYWARLLNTVPYSYNWLKPCEDIPITIHGRTMKTTRCWSNPDALGEVFGHWLVDFEEPLCTPFWDQIQDKGCTAEGSGQHRYLAHLVNFHDGEVGERLCASTPIDLHGRHFDSPHSCVNWGRIGIHGFWEIDDPDC